MGLDQYLSVRKYIRRDTQAFDNTVITNDMHDLVEADGWTGIFMDVPAMYWRKFNALHDHIVQTYADGRDECQQIELTVEDLRKIVKRLDDIVQSPDRAPELLPTADGFFFGGTEYDEYYHEEVRRTRSELGELVRKLDSKAEELYPIYQASW